MPLLTENERINATLAEDAKNIAAHLEAAANKANRMVSTMLGLDDAALTSWLNSQQPADTQGLFAAHGELGSALNAAITVADTVLTSSGIGATQASVDTRSVAEKLSGQGRVLSFDNGAFSVTTPTPDSEP